MKIRNYDSDKDNYYDGKKMVFHKYKTSAVYGKQEIKPPPALKRILTRWIILNPHDYLLSSYDGHRVSISRMTLLMNKMFGGKSVSTTMLRHVYISENVLKDAPTLRQMEQVAEDMGHSVGTQALYRKVE
jgi:hypothetical protein